MKRAAALLLLSAAGLAAQSQMLEILAPSNRVTAGDTLALTALQVGDTTVTVTQFATWTVDQPAVASIDSGGKLTGKTLGLVKVTATYYGSSHDLEIQVVPDHTTITPGSANLTIGDTQQFTATAYDLKGNPIPNVPWTWSIVSTMDDGTPQVPYGTISTSGLLTAAYEGPSYVRAVYTYTGATGAIPGMESRIPLYAPFTVSAPRPFQVSRVFNATQQIRQNPVLRTRPSLLWSAPDGSLLFNASLDSVATALTSWDGKNFNPLLATGSPSNSAGSIVTDLRAHSMAANGQILTNEVTSDGNRVETGAPGALRPLLVANVAIPGGENVNGFNITRNSLSSGGAFVFTGSFRVPGTNTYANGLMRGFGNVVSEILFSQLDQLPELGGIAGVTVNDFGVDNNGIAWYVANVPGKTTLFRHDSTGRRKFLAVGDPLLGSTVRTFFGNRNSTSAYWFAENSDVVFGVGLNDGRNFLLRYTGSDATQPAQMLRIDNGTVPLSYQPDGTVLFYGNPNPNKGDGAWLWKGSSLQPVALINQTRINGQPVQSIESGMIDSSGNVTLMVATASVSMAVVTFAGSTPTVLFQTGDATTVSVPSLLAAFVPDGRNGNPLLISGSATGASVAEWRDGAPQPMLSVGDRVLGGSPYGGASVNGYVQRVANGDFYSILPGVGIGRFTAAGDRTWGTALAFPLKLDDGANASLPYRIAVNNTGAIVWASGTDKGDTRVYLSQGGANQIVCSNGLFLQAGSVLAGQAVYTCDDFFVDDTNRVLIRAHIQGQVDQRSFVWSNGSWQLAAQVNQTLIGGRLLTGVNAVRPAGSHIYAALQTDAGTSIAEWTDAGWSVLFGPNDKMPTGFYLNYVSNLMEGTSQGDLVFASQAYPSWGIYFRRNGQLSTILTTGRRTADGDYMVSLLGIDVRDDGTVYVLALNEKDEQVLYMASPL